jgi:hypothetical protein
MGEFVLDESRGKRETWRKENRGTPKALTLAVVAMSVMGFGLVGAFLAGNAVASKVAQSAGMGPAAPALAAIFHGPGVQMSAVKTTSGNWAGYADTVPSTAYGTITEAFGEWVVPSINCAKAHGASLNDNWVGIDGYGTGTVEQAGTLGYCSSSTATPYYYDWFEFYPYSASVGEFYVAAGDVINAYVLYNPYVTIGNGSGIYTLVVNDLSDYSASFSVTGTPNACTATGCETGPDGSAECISEQASQYLADYGTTGFVSCDSTIGGTWSGIGGHGTHATLYEISQKEGVSGKVDQTPSKLTTYDYKDDYFTITWKHYD